MQYKGSPLPLLVGESIWWELMVCCKNDKRNPYLVLLPTLSKYRVINAVKSTIIVAVLKVKKKISTAKGNFCSFHPLFSLSFQKTKTINCVTIKISNGISIRLVQEGKYFAEISCFVIIKQRKTPYNSKQE